MPANRIIRTLDDLDGVNLAGADAGEYLRYTGSAWEPSSAGTSTYTHNQAGASATWTITHNLGLHPSVTVVDSAGNVVIGNVVYSSENQIVISFSAAFAGKAYLN